MATVKLPKGVTYEGLHGVYHQIDSFLGCVKAERIREGWMVRYYNGEEQVWVHFPATEDAALHEVFGLFERFVVWEKIRLTESLPPQGV